jgi:hypothetical protein
MNTCPICNRQLEETDLLILKYHAPKNWWVTYHLRKDITEELKEIRKQLDHLKEAFSTWRHTAMEIININNKGNTSP